MWRATESDLKRSSCESSASAFASAGSGGFGEIGEGLCARRECQEVLKRQLERQPPVWLPWGAAAQQLRSLEMNAVRALPKFMEVRGKLMQIHESHLALSGIHSAAGTRRWRDRVAVALALLTSCNRHSRGGT
jgi:hypothetical protein